MRFAEWIANTDRWFVSGINLAVTFAIAMLAAYTESSRMMPIENGIQIASAICLGAIVAFNLFWFWCDAIGKVTNSVWRRFAKGKVRRHDIAVIANDDPLFAKSRLVRFGLELALSATFVPVMLIVAALVR